MNGLVVTAFPRLHFGLLDLAHATSRKYGGVGVVLDWPAYEVAIASATELEFGGFSSIDDAASDGLQSIVRRYLVSKALPPCRIDLRKVLPQHVGLGSKTALTLAILVGLNEYFSSRESTADLQFYSGRGGVSGVGVHGFFSGGLIVDVGQFQDRKPHLPSALVDSQDVSLLQLRNPVAESWLFYLLLPNGVRYAGADERDLFLKHSPIPSSEVFESIALVYHGIVPAFATNQLQPLRAALRRIGEIGFKAREIAAQTNEARMLLDRLYETGICAAGMSSVGPLVFAVSNIERAVVEPEIQSLCSRLGATVLQVCPARNSGYLLSWGA